MGRFVLLLFPIYLNRFLIKSKYDISILVKLNIGISFARLNLKIIDQDEFKNLMIQQGF